MHCCIITHLCPPQLRIFFFKKSFFCFKLTVVWFGGGGGEFGAEIAAVGWKTPVKMCTFPTHMLEHTFIAFSFPPTHPGWCFWEEVLWTAFGQGENYPRVTVTAWCHLEWPKRAMYSPTSQQTQRWSSLWKLNVHSSGGNSGVSKAVNLWCNTAAQMAAVGSKA